MFLKMTSLVTFLSIVTSVVVGNVPEEPTVFVAVLVRNKAHSLPYFLSCLYEQDYPKHRMHIWMYSDHNEDDSALVLEAWRTRYGRLYGAVNVTLEGGVARYGGDEPPTHWSAQRFSTVIRLREEALTVARGAGADYLLMVDADVVLSERRALRSLVSKQHTVVAPMLTSDGLYSNFWCGMSAEYYYERTEQYGRVLRREEGAVGCVPVKMVHSAVLVALRAVDSALLTYLPHRVPNYDGPHDDIIAFAVNAHRHGVPLVVCNDEQYGFVPVPAEAGAPLSRERALFTNLLLEAASRLAHVAPLPALPAPPPDAPDTLFCDRVYVINLRRRTQRRRHMAYSLGLLNIDATFIDAVDGSAVDLRAAGVTLMPGYVDPYRLRPITAGEVGCFLSHYYIWQEIAKEGHSVSLVLEDDIKFTSDFRTKFLGLMDELKHHDWDLVYIGRKQLSSEETPVSESLVSPEYSYWTLGYLLSAAGARALLRPQPLTRLIPVDEYLPIMYDKHPNETLSRQFPEKGLRALAAAPVLVTPTHYTGDAGYVSDTEDSPLVHRPHLEL